MKQVYPQTGLEQLCGLFGYSRQAYYKHQKSEEQQAFEQAIVVDLVEGIRKNIPRIGGKKLHFLLGQELARHQIKLGRDGFFEVLRSHGLLVNRRKRRAQTTWSGHRLKKYPNLIEEIIPLSANELWVSDITYIQVQDRWNYVIFITDAYSHKVVGHNVGEYMSADFCGVALDQALAQWQDRSHGLIHHSDRGVQYCSGLYTQKLLDATIQISMTQKGDPRENAVAERANGIFKTDFAMDRSFENFDQAKSQIENMVFHYNHTRPHLSCDRLTPAKAHEKKGPLRNLWKRKLSKNFRLE